MRSRSTGGGLGVKDSTDVSTSDASFENSLDGLAGPSSYSFSQDLFGTGLGFTGYFGQPAGAPTSSGTLTLSALSGEFVSPSAFAAENITLAGSGIVFHNTYDSTVDASYRSAIIAAENFIQGQFANPVTINLNFSMAAIGGGNIATNFPTTWIPVSYSSFVQALRNNATTNDDRVAVNTLSGLSDPTHGLGLLLLPAEAQILGLSTVAANGTVQLNSAFSYFYNGSPVGGRYDAISTLEHEITEQMGRLGELGLRRYVGAPYNIWGPTDFFRYSSSGVRSFSGAAAYFSVDGVNLLTRFNQEGFGDSADWNGVISVPGGIDSFGSGITGTRGIVTQTDLRIMDIIGWNAIPPVVIESAGSTSLVRIGNTYSMFPVGGTSGPQLKMAGQAVTQGQFGSWYPMGAEAIAGGYEIAWNLAGNDQYTVWNTDSNGNFLSNIGVVSGFSATFELLEPSFHQDFNGDGLIGPSVRVIETVGTTSFLQVGNNYMLGNLSGPQLKMAGSSVTRGQFGSWFPMAAEAITGGYEIAWNLAGNDQFTVWNTDSNGNFLSNIGVVSGFSATFELLEPSFHQDLNGDSLIGPSVRVVESVGTTSLLQVGNNYMLGSLSGPQVKMAGNSVTQGQFGAWYLMAAEAITGGYEIAWNLAGFDQFTVWNTDSNGNFVSNIGVVSGFSYAMESLEPSFHQDLNGDGTTGLVSMTIEALGSTSLVKVANNFFFGGLTGVQLKMTGVPVTAGQYGAWMPIGGEAISGGFEVAWKNGSLDQYTVWNTNSSGNYLSSPTGTVSGFSYAMESLESSFHQDLNGDGTIGLASSPIESAGSTSLVKIADNFFLGGLAGVQLKMSGVPVVAGQFGAWKPIGGEAIAGGFEIAWQNGNLDQFTFWNTNSNGNYVSDTIGVVTGSSTAGKQAELRFHQDFNGNGTIGQSVGSPGASVGSGDLALLTNYIAAFAPQTGEGVSAGVAAETYDQEFLAKPNA